MNTTQTALALCAIGFALALWICVSAICQRHRT